MSYLRAALRFHEQYEKVQLFSCQIATTLLVVSALSFFHNVVFSGIFCLGRRIAEYQLEYLLLVSKHPSYYVHA